MEIKNLSENIIEQCPERLQRCITAVLEEDAAYAADELVELGEEILAQLAALGLSAYLQQSNQRSALNDHIITMFLSARHQNSGSVYRWVAHMVKSAEGEQAKLLLPFFWQDDEAGNSRLNPEVNHLSELRNAVMHGFFVLPPDRNEEEAAHMATILNSMMDAGLFNANQNQFHFCNATGFTGRWHIQSPEEWGAYEACHAFGILAKRTVYENSPGFLKDEKDNALSHAEQNTKVVAEVQEFLNNRDRGALSVMHLPNNADGEQLYRTVVQAIDTERFTPVCYRLNADGVAYSASFLQQALTTTVAELLGESPKWLREKWLLKESELKKHTSKLAALPKRPVVVIGAVHTAMFSSEHLLHLVNQLYTAGIPLIAVGWHHSNLSRYFNASITVNKGKVKMPDQQMLDSVTRNYLRFKEDADTEGGGSDLVELMDKLKHLIANGSEVAALRYAKENELNTELVHEAMSILAPFFHTKRVKFEMDELHPLFGYPKEYTESSHVFLHLGRRDSTLDYRHTALTQ